MDEIFGKINIEEAADSPTISIDEGYSVTRRYKGFWDALVLELPDKGDEWQDTPGTRVARATLSKEKGGLAVLEVTLVSPPDSENDETTDLGELEISFVTLEKPLLAHPLFNGYEMMACDLEAWKTAPPSLKKNFQYKDESGATQTLHATMQKVAKKMLRGIEAYRLDVPVITLTKTLARPPSNVGGYANKIQTPHVTLKPAGKWEYLRGPDKLSRDSSGCYKFTQQWLGAEEWDKDLYGTA